VDQRVMMELLDKKKTIVRKSHGMGSLNKLMFMCSPVTRFYNNSTGMKFYCFLFEMVYNIYLILILRHQFMHSKFVVTIWHSLITV
jgi:hypothetical protein